MKVRLFVQNTWNKRPPRIVGGAADEDASRSQGIKGARWRRHMDDADRWWIVRCQSPFHGRCAIKALPGSVDPKGVPFSDAQRRWFDVFRKSPGECAAVLAAWDGKVT